MKPALEESIQSIQRDQALLQRLHNARLEESPHVGLASLPRLQAAMEVQIAGGHQVHVTLTEPVTAPWAGLSPHAKIALCHYKHHRLQVTSTIFT